MDSHNARGGGLFEAINGGHLHWSDFRENVLRAFRISCTASPAAGEFPEPFLAQLHAAQKDISRHDARREVWRLDVSAGRGLTSLAVFPPNLLPPRSELSPTLRCMSPRMSREGLPLRLPNSKNPLYELPTAKPIYVFGFDMETFSKPEQAYLTGALQVTGVAVDFVKGEVLSSRSLCCPFLAFERFTVNNKRHIETARNSCAITGAQCLRGQQHLFHKAFGLQTVSQPPITFTCALNNEQAIINYHSIGEDGEYKMAALCKFDLQDDEHFNTFQAWVEAIDNWATVHLLSRIRRAISEVAHFHPTPPPSPSPSNVSLLSIDTKSGDVLPILSELRRLCPTIPWRNDSMTVDTPINSSIAQCGTPLPTREIRSLSLLRPHNSDSSMTSDDTSEPDSGSFMSPNAQMSDMLSPLRTNLPLSACSRPRTLAQHRLMFSPGLRTSFSQSDRPGTPDSPCRPATLSPCTPGPDMPMSNMNPILVLQRRLDVAVGEIQELRDQVDDLQAQLNCRTGALEQKLRLITDRQDDAEKSMRFSLSALSCNSTLVGNLDDALEQELKTPTTRDVPWGPKSPGLLVEATPDSDLISQDMPCSYQGSDEEEDSIPWTWPIATEDFAVWCLAKILKDNNLQLSLLVSLALILCCTGLISALGLCANIMFMVVSDECVRSTIRDWLTVLNSVLRAAEALDLDINCADQKEICESSVVFKGVRVDVQVDGDGEEDGCQVEYVPVVLC